MQHHEPVLIVRSEGGGLAERHCICAACLQVSHPAEGRLLIDVHEMLYLNPS